MQPATLQPPYHQSVLNAYLACPEALRLTALEGVQPAFRHFSRLQVGEFPESRFLIPAQWHQADLRSDNQAAVYGTFFLV